MLAIYLKNTEPIQTSLLEMFLQQVQGQPWLSGFSLQHWLQRRPSQFVLHTGSRQDIFYESCEPDTVNSQFPQKHHKMYAIMSSEVCIHGRNTYSYTPSFDITGILLFWGNICWDDYVGPR